MQQRLHADGKVVPPGLAAFELAERWCSGDHAVYAVTAQHCRLFDEGSGADADFLAHQDLLGWWYLRRGLLR